LSPSDYGALDILSYAALLLALLLGLALDQSIARWYHETEDTSDRKAIASTVLFYTLSVPLTFAIAGATAADEIAKHWLAGQVGPATVIAALGYIWAYGVFFTTTNLLRYQLRAKEFTVCSIGSTTLTMALSLWFIVSLKLGVLGVFLAQIIGNLGFAGVAFYLSRDTYAWTFDWQRFKSMTAYSLPLVPSTMAFFAMQYVDRYVLNELRGLHDVGVYGIGARLASLVYLFLTGFQGAWFPLVMKSYRDPMASEQFKRVFEYFAFATAVAIIWLSTFGREILLILTTPDYAEAFIVVPLQVASAVLFSVGNYFAFGIQIAKKSNIRLAINVFAIFIAIALNIVLIPAFGFFGAAVATFTSALVMAIVAMAVSQKHYFIAYEWRRLFAALTVALVFSYAAVAVSGEISWASAVTKLLMSGIATIILVRLLRTQGAWKVVTSALRIRMESSNN
jgi:O-antigen/teichoic acid export membrane protein